jgi:aminoglycoside phosphotransferase (APT) family kinase protein
MHTSMPEPGPLIASGRAADVYAYGDEHVLRRYRTDHDCTYEAAAMRYLSDHGYPVPSVVDAHGADLVMERLDGPTMLADFERRPWMLFRHAATIAGLLKRLHDIGVPEWFVRRHETGDAIVHLDLHPDNVMLTSRGPVVIDWSNVGRGDPDAEVADLWLVLKCANAPAAGLQRLLVEAGRGLFLSRVLSRFDRDAVRRKLRVAHANRSKDRNMSEAEQRRMGQMVERFAL